MSTLFIADLHLEDKRPDLNRAFLSFCEQTAINAEALYILGDFFNAWIGDDDTSQTASLVIDALKTLSSNGVKVYIQHGNRDFLLGSQFAKACGAELLPEALTISPYGKPILLMHGDQLCLDDKDYQHFRTMVRDLEWQQQFLAKPLSERQQIATELREKSQEANRVKPQDIMDVTPDAVTAAMKNFQVDLLIHGHTHRPKIHTAQSQQVRIVLGDWDEKAWYLELDRNNHYQLIQQAIVSFQ